MVLCALGSHSAAVGAAEVRDVLRPGDSLSITVVSHPELSAQATVDGSGNISLPAGGTMPASGIGPLMLAQRVAQRLDRIIYDPMVDIRLLDRGKSVFISGGGGLSVPGAAGGTIPYVPGMTLTTLVAQLQPGPAVDVRAISIERTGNHMGPYDLFFLQNHPQIVPVILAGDVVTLPNKAIAVIVEGAVKSPGRTFVDPGQSLADAIGQAGGSSENGNTSAIVVKRGATTTVAPLGSTLVGGPAQDGDIVRVPPSVRVTVAGQVEHSGEISLGSDQRLLEALYLAGGPTHWSDLRSVQVIHDGQTHTVDVTKMPYGDAASPDPWLHDGDVVFVPEGHRVDFRGFFQNLLLGAGIARVL
ncbi:MAG: polysaccharide biosynthesis/export family protein [Candidatus Eremiobacteraeota bacterium]|nr:polysaccharide biosynthesis/export family protein [Candidatus Eremiobacteraeota bacterium]